MRLPTAAASILVIGLVAACGGDAAPEPDEGASVAPVATAATSDASGAPAADGSPAAGGSPAGDTAFAKTAQASSADDPGTTYPLVAGRYRMGWTTGSETADPCEQVDFLVSQVDGDFTYPKRSRSSLATAIINDLPEGTYTIEQLDPACTAWHVRVDWMTN